MRILLLNQFFCPDAAPTGQLLADLAQGLAERKHEVHVLCSRRVYNGGRTVLPALETVGGVIVHRVGATGFGRGNAVGRILDYLSFGILAACRALVLPEMDVCVSLTTPPFIGLVGLMLRGLKGTKLVLWTMDLYPQVPVALGLLKRKSLSCCLLMWLSRYMYRNSSVIVSIGEVMTEHLIEAGAPRDRIVTVHNWVPGEVVQPMSVASY